MSGCVCCHEDVIYLLQECWPYPACPALFFFFKVHLDNVVCTNKIVIYILRDNF